MSLKIVCFLLVLLLSAWIGSSCQPIKKNTALVDVSNTQSVVKKKTQLVKKALNSSYVKTFKKGLKTGLGFLFVAASTGFSVAMAEYDTYNFFRETTPVLMEDHDKKLNYPLDPSDFNLRQFMEEEKLTNRQSTLLLSEIAAVKDFDAFEISPAKQEIYDIVDLDWTGVHFDFKTTTMEKQELSLTATFFHDPKLLEKPKEVFLEGEKLKLLARGEIESTQDGSGEYSRIKTYIYANPVDRSFVYAIKTQNYRRKSFDLKDPGHIKNVDADIFFEINFDDIKSILETPLENKSYFMPTYINKLDQDPSFNFFRDSILSESDKLRTHARKSSFFTIVSLSSFLVGSYLVGAMNLKES